MNELIKIEEQLIGNEKINAVDARELWKFLESKQQFGDWIKKRIEEYGFLIDIDYIKLHNLMNAKTVQPQGLKKRIDYALSIDMAKELSMVERNHKGREARKYFIECEKRLKALTPKDYPSALRQLATEYEEKQLLLSQIAKDKPKVEFAEQVVAEKDSLTIGDFAKELSKVHGLNVGPNKLMNYLRLEGYLMKGRDAGEKNKPYQTAIKKGLFEIKKVETNIGRVFDTTFITGLGQLEMTDTILEYFLE